MKFFQSKPIQVRKSSKHWGWLLLVMGISGCSGLISAAIGQMVNGEPSFLGGYLGLALLTFAGIVTLAGFCMIADWTDPFPIDDPNAPLVRKFDDESTLVPEDREKV